MVERFNRRISDDLSKVEKRHRMSNGSYRRFANAQEREEFFEIFVYNYNHTRLKCLGYKSPLEMLENVSNHEANNTQKATLERLQRISGINFRIEDEK